MLKLLNAKLEDRRIIPIGLLPDEHEITNILDRYRNKKDFASSCLQIFDAVEFLEWLCKL